MHRDIVKQVRRLVVKIGSRVLTSAEHDLDQLRRHQQIWTPEDWQTLLTAHTAALNP